MKNKTTRTLLILLLVAVLAAGGVYAAVRYGTMDDPLVSMSYLTDVVEPTLADEYAARADAAVSAAQSAVQSGAAADMGDFTLVTLAPGQTLSAPAGTELLLRAGNAAAGAELSDTTDGTALPAGDAMSPNHLYLTITDTALRAEESLTLMLRGSYQVG